MWPAEWAGHPASVTQNKKRPPSLAGGLDGGLLWLVLCVGGKFRRGALGRRSHVRAPIALPAVLRLIRADWALFAIADKS